MQLSQEKQEAAFCGEISSCFLLFVEKIGQYLTLRAKASMMYIYIIYITLKRISIPVKSERMFRYGFEALPDLRRILCDNL